MLPRQPFDLVGAYARVQHQGAGRQACSVEQLFRGVEKPFCLVQGKGPDAFFPEDGGRNQKGRVSAAPPALQGIIQEAVKWYRLAAEQGNAEAQRLLGDCYFRWNSGRSAVRLFLCIYYSISAVVFLVAEDAAFGLYFHRTTKTG